MADMTPCATCDHAVGFHEADGCHVYVDGGGGKLNAVCSCTMPIVLVVPGARPDPVLVHPPGIVPLLVDFEPPTPIGDVLARLEALGLRPGSRS